MRETEIAAAAKAWLEARGLEVFSEVEFDGHRIDLVGRNRGVLTVVEAKVAMGLDVIAQAMRSLKHANEVYVAVKRPVRGYSDAYRLGTRVCRDHEIGVLEIETDHPTIVAIERFRAPCRWPKHVAALRKALHPEQKTAAPAGTNRGGYSTEWKRWAAKFVEYVRENPGQTLKQAVLDTKPYFCQTTHRRVYLIQDRLAVSGPERDQALAGVRLEGRGVNATLWPVDPETF